VAQDVHRRHAPDVRYDMRIEIVSHGPEPWVSTGESPPCSFPLVDRTSKGRGGAYKLTRMLECRKDLG
jgi:hypothetical protein